MHFIEQYQNRGGSATFKVVRPGSRCGWVWLKRGIVTISKFITY